MPYIGQKPHNKVVTASEISDGIISADKLASNAVTTAKINADAVTDAKIADDVVGTEHLTAGEVDTTALGADAVTAAKIADNAISEEHLDATVVTGLTALAAEPADTDEFLISDAGTLKKIDYSYIKGGGITEADQYRYTASSGGISGDITSNLERVDSDFDKIGTGITNSSGIFSFPSTGIYLVLVQAHINFVNEADNGALLSTYVTTNNSSYNERARAYAGSNSTSNNSNFTVFSSLMVDVTDTSNVKVKFVASSFDSQSYLEGNTDKNHTTFTFIRLGDT